MDGDEGLVSWTEAEEKELRDAVLDLVLEKINTSKNLRVSDALFQAYLGVVWCAAEIDLKVYRDILKRIGDANGVYLEKLNKQVDQARKELTEEGIEIKEGWD